MIALLQRLLWRLARRTPQHEEAMTRWARMHARLMVDVTLQQRKRLDNRLHSENLSTDLRAIVTLQRKQQQCAVQFWEGKLWMLDQMIAQAKAAP